MENDQFNKSNLEINKTLGSPNRDQINKTYSEKQRCRRIDRGRKSADFRISPFRRLNQFNVSLDYKSDNNHNNSKNDYTEYVKSSKLKPAKYQKKKWYTKKWKNGNYVPTRCKLYTETVEKDDDYNEKNADQTENPEMMVKVNEECHRFINIFQNIPKGQQFLKQRNLFINVKSRLEDNENIYKDFFNLLRADEKDQLNKSIVDFDDNSKGLLTNVITDKNTVDSDLIIDIKIPISFYFQLDKFNESKNLLANNNFQIADEFKKNIIKIEMESQEKGLVGVFQNSFNHYSNYNCLYDRIIDHDRIQLKTLKRKLMDQPGFDGQDKFCL